MCLIMLRDRGVVLDKTKFMTAVTNNPDGYGVSTPDGEGRLYTFRDVATDPEELYEFLHDEYKDDRLMIHLRYTTAGETVLRNAHPFPVLEKEADGCDLRMAHNGTLSKWSHGHNSPDRWESDTRHFVRGYVRPLMKRLAKGTTTEDILTDPFVSSLLDDQLTAASVLTFIDGSGNTTVINGKGNGGFVDEDGTYFSNKYSHNPTHRTASYSGGGSYNMGKPQGSTGSSTIKTTDTSTNKKNTQASFTDCSVKKFSDKHGAATVSELFYLSDETLEFMVEEEGEDVLLLLKELLYELYTTKAKLESATNVIASKSRQIKTLTKELAPFITQTITPSTGKETEDVRKAS